MSTAADTPDAAEGRATAALDLEVQELAGTNRERAASVSERRVVGGGD